MSTTLTFKEVKIRKPRHCFFCFRKFEAGSQMKYWTVANDGTVYSGYHCITCDEIVTILRADEPERGHVAYGLDEGQTPEQMLKELKHI